MKGLVARQFCTPNERTNDIQFVKVPVPAPMMKAFLDYIDGRLSSSECDHTLRYAREFIHAQSLPEAPILAWLEGAGGYCDCEAINNAEELLEDAIPGYRDLPPPDGIRE